MSILNLFLNTTCGKIPLVININIIEVPTNRFVNSNEINKNNLIKESCLPLCFKQLFKEGVSTKVSEERVEFYADIA